MVAIDFVVYFRRHGRAVFVRASRADNPRWPQRPTTPTARHPTPQPAPCARTMRSATSSDPRRSDKLASRCDFFMWPSFILQSIRLFVQCVPAVCSAYSWLNASTDKFVLAHKSRSVPAALGSRAGLALTGALATLALRSADPRRAGAASGRRAPLALARGARRGGRWARRRAGRRLAQAELR